VRLGSATIVIFRGPDSRRRLCSRFASAFIFARRALELKRQVHSRGHDPMTDTGDTAPDFTLPRDGGGQITLSALRPKAVVLYFYPKDDTDGCTREAVDFTGMAGAFKKAGAVVIGVSKDSVRKHDNFIRKHGLGVILASDKDNDLCETYGVWAEKSMYGRTYMGIERSTFLIDGAGRVRQVWRKVKINGHAEEVLEAVKALA
jgi:peroxiredoxin Q/BCP